MDKRIPVFQVSKSNPSTTSKEDIRGESVEAISGRIRRALQGKGAGATISGALSKDPKFPETNAYLYVRNGKRNVVKRFWEALTLQDVTQRKAATLAVEHLLQRFEEQPDAQPIVANIRKEMRRSGGEIKAKTLQEGLDALTKKFDASEGDRKKILELDDKAMSRLAKKSGIPREDFCKMRDHVQHRHNLVLGNGIFTTPSPHTAVAPPSPQDVAKVARQILNYATTTPDALEPDLRALYFEAKAFASAYPGLMDLRPGVHHTPGITQKAVFVEAATLLGAKAFDEDKIDDAAQKLAGAIIDQLKKGSLGLAALLATDGGQYRLDLSKALMDAVANQSKVANSGAARLEIPLGELFQRLDTFSKTVFSHVQKAYDFCFDGDALVDSTQNGERRTWVRDVERSAVDGVAGSSLYRSGKQTVLVKEIDVRLDPGTGVTPTDRQEASLEVTNHLLVNVLAPDLAPEVSIASSTDGKVRLVMEQPEYGNMGQFINSQLPGDKRRPEAARAMCWKIAGALDQLHQTNMSHGALRPEDVVLAPGQGDDVIVKLTNFGAAHLGSFMYAREDKVADPNRKSPERLAPKGTLQDQDEPSFSPQKDDVWAFGLMVYRMFSPEGRAAFPDAEANFKKALKKYSEEYSVRPVGRGLPQNDSIPKEAREFIGWMLNPDPAKRPSMTDVLNHPFLAKGPDADAMELVHETGQLQDFIDWGPSQIREFAADTGIEEGQVRAMIEYLRADRDGEAPGDVQDAGPLVGFVQAFRTFFANQTQDTYRTVIVALNDRVEAFAAAHPVLVANPPVNGAQTGSPAITPTPDSVKGVLGKLAAINAPNNAKASGVLDSETVNGEKGLHLGVRIRNGDRNVLARLADRLNGKHIARRKAAQRAVEHLVERFKDQPGAKEILEKLRSAIRNPGKTLRVKLLADSLNKLVDKFDLDSTANTALAEFVGREGADVLAFSKATGIPEELVVAMQAYLSYRSGLLDGSAVKKPPSLERIADFARAFDRYMREASTVQADPAISALDAEVQAFVRARPDLMDLRAGMVHTPGFTEKISFAKAAKLLGQRGELDPTRAAEAAKQLARLIVRSFQDPENAGRDLPMLFASSLGVEYRRELSDALRTAIAQQVPDSRSGTAPPPLRADKLARRLEDFSKVVYAEVLKGLPDHCVGDNVVEGNLATTWTKGKALNGIGATAKLFVYGNGEDSVVVKELKSGEVRFLDQKPTDHVCDFEEARLHRHINASAPSVAPQLHAVVQSDLGNVRFVMEHAIYGDLEGFMEKTSGTADLARNEARFSLCKQVAEGLYELHTLANVGHVDFKPANVLLTSGAGGAVLAQLTDFGASREGRFMYLRDDPVSTPYWQSPERVAEPNGPDDRFSTHAADVWAFGVTVYQMYASDGKNPFDRPGFNTGVKNAILDYAQGYRSTGTPGGNLNFDADIPEGVRPFIRWILNPDPAARPTMADILQHKLMKSARPLSVPGHNFIKASVGADVKRVADAGDAPGAKARTPTMPDGVESDEDSSSMVESSNSSTESSSQSASQSSRSRSSSGSASDSSSEEQTESDDGSGPSGTFRAHVVADRPDTDNEKAMKKSADTKQEKVGMNTMLNPHLKVKRQRKGMTQGTFVKPSGSEDGSD